MQALARKHWPALAEELGAERCCSLQARHVIATGFGRLWVDRWPQPRAVAGFTGGNLGFVGDPGDVAPPALAAVLDELIGDWEHVFVDPGEAFTPVLRAAVRGWRLWPRVLFALPGRAKAVPACDGATIRPLEADDAAALGALSADIAWISDTHDGPAGLAASGRAVGAFVDDRLAAVAAVFYVGTTFEELGVVTEADHRGRGLSAASAAAVVADIQARGRTPCWSTTPDNRASQRVAEKLGFVHTDEQRHLVLGGPVSGSLPLD